MNDRAGLQAAGRDRSHALATTAYLSGLRSLPCAALSHAELTKRAQFRHHLERTR